MSALVVATINVQETLPPSAARASLDRVLEHGPDVVGLQEWYPRRWSLLRRYGSVRLAPGGVLLYRGSAVPRLTWSTGVVGGCVIGLRDEDRFERQGCSLHVLSWPGRSDRGEGGLGVEAARAAVVVRCRDRSSGHLLAFVGYHLVHGVQRGEGYRQDRPRLAARHQREGSRLARLVACLQDEGRDVIAFGDANFDGFHLPGLTSAWSTAESGSGTLGRRRVDDVHAVAPPSSVDTVDTPSDHRAVVARYDPA